MERLLVAFVLGSATFAPSLFAMAQPTDPPSSPGGFTTVGQTSAEPQLPALPPGKSTILGGQISNVDPVLDRFMLKIYGEKPLRVLYDERTQLYRDGKRIALRDLSACEHASVQTKLDNTAVFAVSIHILSKNPEGSFEGKVVRYNPGSGELVLSTGGSDRPFTIWVSGTTSFTRKGQATFTSEHSGPSDLTAGSLVSAQFESGKDGRGSATAITILATPGSAFVFSGNITYFDLSAGRLTLLDPLNNETYQISFDPANTPEAQNFHTGERVRVTAQYDGTRYASTGITAY